MVVNYPLNVALFPEEEVVYGGVPLDSHDLMIQPLDPSENMTPISPWHEHAAHMRCSMRHSAKVKGDTSAIWNGLTLQLVVRWWGCELGIGSQWRAMVLSKMFIRPVATTSEVFLVRCIYCKWYPECWVLKLKTLMSSGLPKHQTGCVKDHTRKN